MAKEALHLIRTATPLVLAQLAFAANAFVTQVFLARHSATALHASLPGSMLAVTLSAFFINTLGYSGTLIAQRHGSGDECGANRLFAGALLLTVLSIPLFFLAAPLGLTILGIFNTEPAVLAAESAYFKVLLVNGFFTALAAVLGGYFTGRGQTRLVGGVTIFGFLLNMALAPIFINGLWGIPTEGVIGAGWSATIAHIVPCAILALCIARTNPSNPSNLSNLSNLSPLLRLGLPNGLRSVIEIGGFFLFTAFLAECAPAAVAASTLLFAINNLPYNAVQGLAQAVEILIGHTPDRTRQRGTIFWGIILAIGIALLYVMVLWMTSVFAPSWFLPTAPNFSTAEFTNALHALVAVIAAKAVFEFLTLILQAILRGRGETSAVCRIQATVSFGVWIPAYALVRFFHPNMTAYWLTMLLSGLVSVALLTRTLRR